MAGRNIVYFDLETRLSFHDVGGAAHKGRMGVSVAGTFSTVRGGYELYSGNDLEVLAAELIRADLVVGWNHVQFDYPVLQPHVLPTLDECTVNLDMMLELEKLIGFRPRLGDVASATLGERKTADGLQALVWWQEYERGGDPEPLMKIAEYCAHDVKVTRRLHEHALAEGRLRYPDRSGKVLEVEVDWK